jgi:hypothetical protein
MKIEPGLELDPRMAAALEELAATISQHYPGSSFRVSRGEDDPTIVQLIATIDVEDTDPVLDVVMERLLELQETLPVFVVTERPLERTIAMREAAEAQKRAVVPTASL